MGSSGSKDDGPDIWEDERDGITTKSKKTSKDVRFPTTCSITSSDNSSTDASMSTKEEETLKKKLIGPLIFAPKKLPGSGGHGHGGHADEEKPLKKEDEIYTPRSDDNVHRATRRDKIKAGILFAIMASFTGVCIGWKTHLDESHSIFGVVGKACVTPCNSNSEGKDFFNGHSHLHANDVIGLKMYLDPVHGEYGSEPMALIDIIRLDKNDDGSVTESIVHSEELGPADEHHREIFDEKVTVDWDNPDYDHIIKVSSSTNDTLSFTLNAMRQTPLSNHSVLVAALIMVVVYIFILVEVIHRTLVAIYGSLIALFFFFLMNGGETESIKVSTTVIAHHLSFSSLKLTFLFSVSAHHPRPSCSIRNGVHLVCCLE
jgi:hypothetical protein